MENKNSDSMLIFADTQLNDPEYLCLDKDRNLYICTLEKENGEFTERIIKKVSAGEALIFIAAASNKAREVITENEKGK